MVHHVLTRRYVLISVENILIIVSSLNWLMATMLKWRRKRGVIGLRPPPGGPIAAKNWISCNIILLVSFKSYLWRQTIAITNKNLPVTLTCTISFWWVVWFLNFFRTFYLTSSHGQITVGEVLSEAVHRRFPALACSCHPQISRISYPWVDRKNLCAFCPDVTLWGTKHKRYNVIILHSKNLTEKKKLWKRISHLNNYMYFNGNIPGFDWR